MAFDLDATMRRASAALAKMDYLACESLCVEALAVTRQARQWAQYARVLLPLQEARRHRRMIAAEGTLRLGSASLAGAPADWLDDLAPGCIVLTRPHTAEEAHALVQVSRQRQLFVEVLWADSAVGDDTWQLRSFEGPKVHLACGAPPRDWRDRFVHSDPGGQSYAPHPVSPALRPADWFIDATEALGQAALANVRQPPDTVACLEALEECLHVFADHEIIHQRLGDLARNLARRVS